MNRYRVICTAQVPRGNDRRHARIIGCGTGTDPENPDRLWTVRQMVRAMDLGTIFYTKGRISRKETEVMRYGGEDNGNWILKTQPDNVRDNNLNRLPVCTLDDFNDLMEEVNRELLL